MHLDGMQLLPFIHFFGAMHRLTLKNLKLELSRIFKGDNSSDFFQKFFYFEN